MIFIVTNQGCKVCVVIFGDGTPDFKLAAKRLGKQVENLQIFSKVAVLDSNSLRQISTRYRNDLIKISTLTTYPLYFRAIKPWAILHFMEENNGFFDVIFYLDAGCEIPNNIITRLQLNHLVSKSFQSGSIAEITEYKETQYSRRNLIDRFGSVSWANAQGQVQSTWSMFKNTDFNRTFMKEWIELSNPINRFWQDPKGSELNDQYEDFVENRWDQSIFSLLYKKYNLYVKRTYWEFGGRFGNLRGVSIPIHATRNKTGLSKLPSYHESNFIAILSLFLNFFLDISRPFSIKLKVKKIKNT